MQETLRITEIFYSLQGETRTAGLPTVFVRLTGCPLRCQYCDTAYASAVARSLPWMPLPSEWPATSRGMSVSLVASRWLNPIAFLFCVVSAMPVTRYPLRPAALWTYLLLDPRVSKVIDLKNAWFCGSRA